MHLSAWRYRVFGFGVGLFLCAAALFASSVHYDRTDRGAVHGHKLYVNQAIRPLPDLILRQFCSTDGMGKSTRFQEGRFQSHGHFN